MTEHQLDLKELKRPDPFLTKLTAYFQLLQQNMRAVVAFSVLVLALIFLAIGLVSLNEKRDDQASAELYTAMKGLKTPNASASIDQIEKFVSEHKKSGVALQALLDLGNYYVEKKMPEKALDAFDRASAISKPKQLRNYALYSKAFQLEDLKKNSEAVAILEPLSTSSDTKELRADILSALARNYAALGNKPKAQDSYSRLVQEFPNTQAAKIAEAMKSKL